MPTDLKLIILNVLLTNIFVLIPPLNTTPVRIILGLPLVLFLPGYALIAVLFPKIKDLESVERLALSFGLSIAVVPLIGLGLNYTPFGIRLLPILISLSIFTVLLCFIASYRRSKLALEERFSVPFSNIFKGLKSSTLSKEKTKLDRILTLTLTLTIIVTIGTILHVITKPKVGEKFTEFYILGENGKAEGYPKELILGQEAKVMVGVVNHEHEDTKYRLYLKLDEETLTTKYVELKDKEKWENLVTFKPNIAGENKKLEFLLYKISVDRPYRNLHLWVNIKQPETEFYILSKDGKAEGYPKELISGQEAKIIVGVVNHEYKDERYKICLKLDGEIIETKSVELKDKEKREELITFKPNIAGENKKLEFLLYKEYEGTPYKSQHLLINIKQPEEEIKAKPKKRGWWW